MLWEFGANILTKPKDLNQILVKVSTNLLHKDRESSHDYTFSIHNHNTYREKQNTIYTYTYIKHD